MRLVCVCVYIYIYIYTYTHFRKLLAREFTRQKHRFKSSSGQSLTEIFWKLYRKIVSRSTSATAHHPYLLTFIISFWNNVHGTPLFSFFFFFLVFPFSASSPLLSQYPSLPLISLSLSLSLSLTNRFRPTSKNPRSSNGEVRW